MEDSELEFSYPVIADQIGYKAKYFNVEPNDEEKEKIIERLGIISLPEFKAKFSLKAFTASSLIMLRGSFEAVVGLKCVVSLDDFNQKISDEFEITFDSKLAKHKGEEYVLDMEDETDAEPIENGIIDLGEIAVQYLSLALPDFPRKEGSELVCSSKDVAFNQEIETKKSSPFDVLAKLKQGDS